MLHKRYNQLICGFDFWGEPQLRDTKNLYELRTYHLKVLILIAFKFAAEIVMYAKFIIFFFIFISQAASLNGRIIG